MFYSLDSFSASRPEMLFTLDGRSTVGMPVGGFSGVSAGRVSLSAGTSCGIFPLGLSGGMFYAIKLFARRMRLMRGVKTRSTMPLQARYSPLAGVATSSRHQLGIIWYYSSSYILYSNRFSLTSVVNIRLLVIASRIFALLYHISL